MSVLVLGAGGHAKVVIELLQASGHNVVGVVAQASKQGFVLGVPIIGEDADLPRLLAEGLHTVFVAIGDNKLRCALAQQAAHLGFDFANAISPAAVISPSAQIGKGVAIMAGAVINAQSKIEDQAIINTRAGIDHDCFIGEGAHIAPGSTLAGGVTIGPRVFVGAGSTIIPNISVCADAQLGAGACVVRDVPEPGLYIGAPARARPRSKTDTDE